MRRRGQYGYSYRNRVTIGDIGDWLLGAFVVVLAVVAVVVLVLAIIAVVLEATEPTGGTVTQLEFIAEHEDTDCSLVGRVTVCDKDTVPDCWQVTFENDGREGESCTSEEEFNTLRVGDQFNGGADQWLSRPRGS
jgi:hypothetical protein